MTSQKINFTLIGPCNQAPVDPVGVGVSAGGGGGHAVLTEQKVGPLTRPGRERLIAAIFPSSGVIPHLHRWTNR